MLTYAIYRLPSTDQGTPGVMVDENNLPVFLTMERQDLDNKNDISDIPPGSYVCETWDSPSKGKVFRLNNVVNRSNVLIHSANLASELKGCISVGKEFGKINGQEAILLSKQAFIEFMDKLKGVDSFRLVIKNVA